MIKTHMHYKNSYFLYYRNVGEKVDFQYFLHTWKKKCMYIYIYIPIYKSNFQLKKFSVLFFYHIFSPSFSTLFRKNLNGATSYTHTKSLPYLPKCGAASKAVSAWRCHWPTFLEDEVHPCHTHPYNHTATELSKKVRMNSHWRLASNTLMKLEIRSGSRW